MQELKILRIPRVDATLAPMVLDLSDVYSAASRIQEVATVNVYRAPELLATFNVAYLNVSRFIAAVEYEYEMAEKRIGELKAILLFDRMEGLLQAAGLANSKNPVGSADIRELAYARDPEIMAATSAAISMKHYVRAFQELKKSFQMAYDGVKKVMGDGINSQGRQNQSLVVPLTTDANSQLQRRLTQTEAQNLAEDDDFFGTAK